MATAKTTKLDVNARSAGSSRETRRLRRTGAVPGVLYGRGQDPVCFSVNARELRHALAGAGAVLELSVDGGEATPAVLKDSQLHPVRGEIIHVDLLRVDLTRAIHAMVAIELLGGEDAPGTKEGGVLEHVTREINVEALPSDIPEYLQLDVSQMDINDTLTLESITAPEGVTLLDDLETTIATLTPPRLQLEEEEEIEEETGLVGEGEAEAVGEGEAEGGPGRDAAGDSGDSGDSGE
jgi:large subunit ribosomal protein L25